MIKAVYHPSAADYDICKDMGFSHVEISVNAWPGSLEAVPDALKQAAAHGLIPILDLGFGKYGDRVIIDFIKNNADLLDAFGRQEIYYLPDEANLYRIASSQLMLWSFLIHQLRHEVKTMAVLSSIRSLKGYENCADIIGVDYYKGFSDVWSLWKAVYSVAYLRFKHRGELINVPAIRYSPAHIRRQFDFWTLISGSPHFYWYSWTPNQEQPPWFSSDLGSMEDNFCAVEENKIREALREINGL